MTPSTEKTVREIAIENPATVRIFESLGIDYCCGGRRSLREACERANVSVDGALELIAATVPDSRGQGQEQWMEKSMGELVDHIVAKHHGFVRQESARLEVLLEKVRSRHGDPHPELQSIQELFGAVTQELAAHMMKEEQVLFPFIKRLEGAHEQGGSIPTGCFESIEMPIARMLAEHDDAGELIAQIRLLSGDFQPPRDACPSYRGLYHGLEQFERDLHRHVHLENNILFPRAVNLERGTLANAQ